MGDLNLPAYPSVNPYVGPRTFTGEVRDRFFGREREARNLHDILVFSDLVLFYAQSGAGKSSLINARVIPLLQEEDGFEILPIGRIGGEIPAGVETVDDIYAFNLMMSLEKSIEDPNRLAHMELADFLNQLETGDALMVPDADEVPHRLLVIDQFEGILTTHPGHWRERADFFSQLGRAIKADPTLHILLVMREDYVAALDPYAPLVPDRLRTRFYMERMGVAAALDAIRRPAELGGRPFAAGVAEKLVDDLRQIRVLGQEGTVAGEYIEPVQLQVVCYQLWENIRNLPPGPITDADLQMAGDVDQALSQFYEEAIQAALGDRAASSVSERQLRVWFDQELITEAGTRGLRHQGEQETGGLPNAVVWVLQRRFLVRTETRSGDTWIELVHDRLVEPIRRSNSIWLAQNISTLQRQAGLWQQQGRPDGLLLAGDTLTEAEHWAAANRNELSAHELDFLARSQARSQESRLRTERERQQNRRIRTLAIVAVAISLISIAVAVWALMTC